MLHLGGLAKKVWILIGVFADGFGELVDSLEAILDAVVYVGRAMVVAHRFSILSFAWHHSNIDHSTSTPIWFYPNFPERWEILLHRIFIASSWLHILIKIWALSQLQFESLNLTWPVQISYFYWVLFIRIINIKGGLICVLQGILHLDVDWSIVVWYLQIADFQRETRVLHYRLRQVKVLLLHFGLSFCGDDLWLVAFITYRAV